MSEVAVSEKKETSRGESSGPSRFRAWFTRHAPEIVFLATCLGICSGAIASSDTWWHLATGRWIFQHHAVPHQDLFSFTVAGKPWIAHEYLTELGMYLLHRAGGFALLSVLNALLLTLAFWLVLQRCKGRPWVNVAVVLLAAWAALPGFAIRPQSITLLFGAATLWIVDEYLRYSEQGQERVGRRVLLLLPLMTLLWAQMHGGFLLGAGLLGAIVLTECVDWFCKRGGAGPETWLALGATGVACLVLALLNPNGFALLRFPFDVMGMKSNAMISEWQRPALELPQFYPFVGLVVLTLAAMMFSPKRYRPGQFILFSLFVYAALRSGRNIPIAAIVLAPLAAEHLRSGWLLARLDRISATTRYATVSALAIIAAGFGVYGVVKGVRFQQSAEEKIFPSRAVTYIAEHHLAPNLLNDYGYGGYLIWRLYPEYKVYVDGRADLYGDSFLKDYIDLHNGQTNPKPVIARDQIRTVILQRSSTLAGLFYMMTGNNSWRLVYDDGNTVVFVPGTPNPPRHRSSEVSKQ